MTRVQRILVVNHPLQAFYRQLQVSEMLAN